VGLHRGAWALALAVVAASSGGGSRVSAANPPSAETLLDRVVARLGEVSPAFDTQGLLAVTVIRFDTPEWASFQGAEQFKSASVVKALWVAAALDHAGVEAAAPIAAASLYGSSNDAAGRAMDIAGGIDAVNAYAHNLGLAETTAYEWLFGRQRRSVDFPGPVRGLNLTTTDDLAGFWAAIGYGFALGPEEGAALLEWTRGPKDSGEGSRLIARLPAEVGENASFKMGWLPVGREYELQSDETGWGGEPPGTVVTFDRGAIEEAWIHLEVQPGGIGEDEVAVIRVAEQPFVDQLVALDQHCGDVRHVPVADVRAEERPEPQSEGVRLCVHRAVDAVVIGLAAEVEAPAEHVGQVLVVF